MDIKKRKNIMITTIKQYFSSNGEFNASYYAEKAEQRFALAAYDLRLTSIYSMMYRVEAMVKLAHAYVSLKFHQSNAYLVTKVSQMFSSSKKVVTEDTSSDEEIARPLQNKEFELLNDINSDNDRSELFDGMDLDTVLGFGDQSELFGGMDLDEVLDFDASKAVKAEDLADAPVSRVYQVAVVASVAALGYALTR
jgi:hypothetical protein